MDERLQGDSWADEAGFARSLSEVVGAAVAADGLPTLAAGVAGALREQGLPVDRIQLPLSCLFGFKHPFLAGMVLTWTDGGGDEVMLRRRAPDQRETALALLVQSPFAPLLRDGVARVELAPGAPGWEASPMLRRLGAQGFTGYLAVETPLPDGARQVISLATRAKGGFPARTPEVLEALRPALALALFAVYQAHTAQQVAATYLGPRTGARVLAGEMGRGTAHTIDAVVAFFDIRGFTRLSAERGADEVVNLVNHAFDALDRTIVPAGGEILKFIGDAALVVFPVDHAGRSCADILAVLLDALDAITVATAAAGCPLAVGVGVHVGSVLYGNVGSEARHDFTVMGPAVNLASRLESLTKRFGVSVVASSAFALACQATCEQPEATAARLGVRIEARGSVAVAGLADPVEVWTLDRAAPSAAVGAGFPPA
jgi:adenylate cyclase